MGDVLGTQEVSLWNKEETKAVSVVTDGAVERLAVNALISNSEAPTRYQLKTDYDAVGDTITSAADVTLYSFSGSGVLDFVAISNATSSNYLVAIVVDGVERIRISMGDLGTNLSLTSNASLIWCETANKNFRFRPTEIGFTTGFSIVARATGANTTVTHMTMFRERVA